MLRQANPIAGGDVASMRAGMDAATAAFTVPAEVRFEPVDAGGVPAEWTTAPGAREDRALVYLHGGAYCLGAIASYRGLAARVSRLARLRVLNVDYRLAPEHPYPAAVDDAVAALRFAYASGLAPSRVAVGGDSAGGGLALATLVALRAAGDALPAAGVCLSPWTDLSGSGESMRSRAILDPLVEAETLAQMAEHYLAGRDPRTPLASPLFANLRGLPPLLVHVGSAEILLDDATRLAERARDVGVDVQLEVWDDMIHVWHAFADALPEGEQAVQGIADFLEKQLG
ncbi:MAG: alpha/beta hydrolase [Myxococcales bacterium]|nr:MAG: alpha/beta hydrolase [Myxococcales bacterium]